MARGSFWEDPYLSWVAARLEEGLRLDLGSSGLQPEWEGVGGDTLPLEGPNLGGDPALRRLLGERLGVGAAGIATAPGCSGANAAALAALCRPGDGVVLESPVYSPLRTVAEGLGLRVETVRRLREERWGFDLATVAAALRQARVLVITNPHNPTGRLLGAEELRDLAGLTRASGAFLLVDEVYREFPGGEAVPSAATLGDHVVATGSLTKAYGLGGLRVGWAAAAPALARRIAAAAATLFGRASVPGEWLAVRFLADPGLAARRDRIARRVAAGKEAVRAFLARQPDLTWVEPDVGIVGLVELPRGLSGNALAEAARREGLYLVPGEFFGVAEAVRLSFGVEPEVLREGLLLLERLLEVLRP